MAVQAKQKNGPKALLGVEMVYFDTYKRPTAAASTVGLPGESGPQLISYYLAKICGSTDRQRAVLQKHPELIERPAAEQQTQAACTGENMQPVSQTRFNKVLVALAMMYRKKIPTALSYRTAARFGSEAYTASPCPTRRWGDAVPTTAGCLKLRADRCFDRCDELSVHVNRKVTRGDDMAANEAQQAGDDDESEAAESNEG
jgi:hypothetical protein